MSITNQKGDIGELRFELESRIKGYNVAKVTHQDCPYDYIIERNGNLERVQVKFREIDTDDTIKIALTARSYNNRRNYTPENIDYFAVYIGDLDRIVYIPIADFFGKADIRLKNNPPKNNQVKNVNFIQSYLDW